MRTERILTDAEHITHTHELLTHAARRVPAIFPRSVMWRQRMARMARREALEVGCKGLVIERALALLL